MTPASSTRPSMIQLARAERTELAAFVTTLTAEEWDVPSLCTGWTVRDVVAHMLSYDELDLRATLIRFVQGRFNPNRINALGVAASRDRSSEQLVELLGNHLTPRGFTTGFGGMIAFLDCLIHQQDIRRSLGKPRDIPAERLRRALPAALIAPPIRAFWRARGLRLVATDIGWEARRGPEVRGPGEALLMAIAGRADALDELTGAGLATLAQRVTG